MQLYESTQKPLNEFEIRLWSLADCGCIRCSFALFVLLQVPWWDGWSSMTSLMPMVPSFMV